VSPRHGNLMLAFGTGASAATALANREGWRIHNGSEILGAWFVFVMVVFYLVGRRKEDE